MKKCEIFDISEVFWFHNHIPRRFPKFVVVVVQKSTNTWAFLNDFLPQATRFFFYQNKPTTTKDSVLGLAVFPKKNDNVFGGAKYIIFTMKSGEFVLQKSATPTTTHNTQHTPQSTLNFSRLQPNSRPSTKGQRQCREAEKKSALCVCISTSHAHATESKANYYTLHAKPADVGRCNPKKNLPDPNPVIQRRPIITMNTLMQNMRATNRTPTSLRNPQSLPNPGTRPEHSPERQVLQGLLVFFS